MANVEINILLKKVMAEDIVSDVRDYVGQVSKLCLQALHVNTSTEVPYLNVCIYKHKYEGVNYINLNSSLGCMS